MKKITFTTLPVLLIAILFLFAFKNKNNESKPDARIISFYEVPLVCGADPDIGCGSRVKPLFIETAKENKILESWLNREGTLLAIVWDPQISSVEEQEKLIKPLFDKFEIQAVLITDQTKQNELARNINEPGKWLKGMDVDKLSLEEAGTIAKTLVAFGKSKGLLNEQEADAIKNELEDYFKVELVKVRTYEELKSEETQDKWASDGYKIFEKHIGTIKTEKISKLYKEEQSCKEENKESCCDKDKKNKDNSNKDCCKKK